MQIVSIGLLAIVATRAHARDGDLDPSFAAAGKGFYYYECGHCAIARLLAGGTLDANFGHSGSATFSGQTPVFSAPPDRDHYGANVVIQPDIVVGGSDDATGNGDCAFEVLRLAGDRISADDEEAP